MNTKSAAVSGARHQRTGRNGQDAAAAWCSGTSGAGALGAVVVCDGCSAGASSEVGARLGAQLVLRALVAQLSSGASPAEPELWLAVRREVVAALAALAGGDASLLRECLLFTVVAAAATPEVSAVWTVGDGAYSFGDRTRVLGPFADNAPPYLAYELIGDPPAAHLEVTGATPVVIATDGAVELGGELEAFACERYATHPDALRRELALRARSAERIVWEERRIERVPARLQDDCAIGVIWR